MEIEQRQASKISSSRVVVSKANTMASRRRQAEQPGWAFGQKPRKGLALHRQTYIHRLSDLPAHSSADAKPCLHVLGDFSLCLLVNSSMLPPQFHSYIYAYFSFPVIHGRTAFGIVANVPRHPRGGTGRLPWGPPRPPTSAEHVHSRQLSPVSMGDVHARLVLMVLVTGLLMPVIHTSPNYALATMP